MRKFYLAIILSVFALNTAYSQCTPVNFPGPNVTLPDTSIGLPSAVATLVYSEIVHVRIPLDTTISSIPVHFDSVGLVGISGMPVGFTYITNSATDYWDGGTYGCIVLQGNPAESDTGDYVFYVNVIVASGSNQIPFTYEFKMKVLDSINAGFSPNDYNKFTVHQNSPNPFSESTTIKFNSPKSSDYGFEVYDLVGNLIEKNIIHAQRGVNKILFQKENLRSGIYFYKLSNDNNSIVKRMVIR